MDRPNVLLILTDQQRWDALGAAGNPHIHTPNLDALAARGTLFENAFCNAPVCMPSRQSLLSGQYPSALGSTCNGVEMRQDVPCLHNLLGPYGYRTGQIGKLHFLNHSNRDHREPHPDYGFDVLVVSDEPGCYEDAYVQWVAARAPGEVDKCRVAFPPAAGRSNAKPPRGEPYDFESDESLTHSAFVADETVRFIRQSVGGNFFGIAGFFAPHPPLNPPRRFAEMYDPDALPLPAQDEGQDLFGMAKRSKTGSEWRRWKQYYYALVSHVDEQVGRILDALDDSGLRDDTLVVFTSDHGEHLGDHFLTGKGHPHWDSCCRVPLLASWPGRLPQGERRSEIVELVDVLPTVLECCAVQAPPFAQGRSFLPLLAGGEYQERTAAFTESKIPFQSSWKSVRTRDWFYAADGEGRELLYDLAADPDQLRDVSANSEAREALHVMRRELLSRWFGTEKQYPLRTGTY